MSLNILDTTDTNNVRIKVGDLVGSNNGAAFLTATTGNGGNEGSGPNVALNSIPNSTGSTGVELRIKSIFVKDNGTPSFGPFPGRANLYLVTIVASDVPNQSAAPVNITTCERIGDDEALQYKESTLFYFQKEKETDKFPNQLHVVATVIKSKESLRDAGSIMANLQGDTNYTTLVSKIVSLATDATAVGAVIEIITQLGGIIGKALGKVEDRPLASIMRSFTSLGGDWDTLGDNIVSMPTRNVNFNFELIVRDAGKEAVLKDALGQ